MTTHYYQHKACLRHEPGIHHPESPDRLRSIAAKLNVTDFENLHRFESPKIKLETIAMMHDPKYIDSVLKSIPERGSIQLDADTILSSGSGEAILRAAGGVCAAIDDVLKHDASNAFCGMRPPGHHAEFSQSMGFCIYNNIGLAIMEARAKGLVDRVAVVDWDVHHGNGTQQAFYDSPDVLTISLHQEMLYPANMGKLSEQGEGNGEGFNINVPLPAGCGGEAYLAAMEQVVVPALRHFKPELIVVACGYDASYFDPMSHMLLISSHYRQMTEIMMKLSNELCDGRLVVNHEGGYSEFYVPFCGAAVIEAISGIESGIVDPSRATAFVENQLLKPHQQAQIDAAVSGPLQRCLQG